MNWHWSPAHGAACILRSAGSRPHGMGTADVPVTASRCNTGPSQCFSQGKYRSHCQRVGNAGSGADAIMAGGGGAHRLLIFLAICTSTFSPAKQLAQPHTRLHTLAPATCTASTHPQPVNRWH